jgi:rubrerythrin
MKFKEMLSEMELVNVKADKFDDLETVRAIRQAQIAELDAVNTYLQIAQSTTNKKVRALFIDVAEEEKVHFGEFQKLLDYMSTGKEEEAPFKKGEKEAAEKLD